MMKSATPLKQNQGAEAGSIKIKNSEKLKKSESKLKS